MKKNKKRNFLFLVLVLLICICIPVQAGAKVKLNKKSVSVLVSKSVTLKMQGTKKKVKWKSSNAKIAKVNSSGKVTGKKNGKVTITATVGKKKYSCKVTVKTGLDKRTCTLTRGETTKIKLCGTSVKGVKSSNKAVVTVNKKGKITAKKKGSATITFTGNNKKKYKCKVIVKDKKSAVVTTAPVIYYTVSFDSMGGSSISSCAVQSGGTVSQPDTPMRYDYDFAGWYLDTEYTQKYDFSTPVKADITLYAKWNRQSADNLEDDVIDRGDIEHLHEDGKIDVIYDDNGGVSMIDGDFSETPVYNASDAADLLNRSSQLFGEDFDAGTNQISVQTVNTAGETSETFYRYEPTVNGVPVLGNQIILTTNEDGTVNGLHSTYQDKIENIYVSADIDAETAKNAAISDLLSRDEVQTYLSKLAEVTEKDFDTVKEAFVETLSVNTELAVDALDQNSKPRLAYVVRIAQVISAGDDDADEELEDPQKQDGEINAVENQEMTEDPDVQISEEAADEFADDAVVQDSSTEENIPNETEISLTEEQEADWADNTTEDANSEEAVDEISLTEEQKAELSDDTTEDESLEETAVDIQQEDETKNSAEEAETDNNDAFTEAAEVFDDADFSEFADNDGSEVFDDGTESDSSSLAVIIDFTYYIDAEDDNTHSAGEIYRITDNREGGSDWENISYATLDAKGTQRNINGQLKNNTFRFCDTGRNLNTYKAYYSLWSSEWKLPGKMAKAGKKIFSDDLDFDKTAVSVHANMEAVYDYYQNVLGRNSFDNAGAQVKVSYGYGLNYKNAYWSSSIQQMVFGGGGGYTKALDVAGHEFTHAVINYVVGDGVHTLSYQGESGALNEAYADILGNLIEGKSNKGRWQIAEDSDGTIRDMSNPSAYDQPENYKNRYAGSNDNGGVHTNSGIFNFAAYKMMSDGRCSGISNTTWAKVFYRSLYRLSTNASFLDARGAILCEAKKCGFSQEQLQAVKDAFDAVGITESDSVRIVLTWGENPSDLDSHLVGPGVNGGRFHIYYSDRSYYQDGSYDSDDSKYAADLDYDDTTSYGPEVTTIYKLTPGDYYFYVHDYTNGYDSTSTEMGMSGATVKIFRGSAKKPFSVYSIGAGEHGTIWNVCKISIDSSGNVEVTPINTYGSEEIYD